MKPISLVPLIALAMPESAYAADILSNRYNNLSCAVFQVTAGENPQGSPRSLGTGFFIDSNGRMVTAAHVLLGANDKSGNSTMQQPQRIILSDKTIIDIPVADNSYPDMQRLIQSDLVVAETGHKTDCFLPVGSDDSVAIGDHGISIGYSFTSEAAMHEGILSARQRAVAVGTDNIFVHLRVELPITVGASGSPLITDDNKVIGIVVQVLLPAPDVVDKFSQGNRQSQSAIFMDGLETGTLGDFLGAFRGYETSGTALVVPITRLGNLGAGQHQKEHNP